MEQNTGVKRLHTSLRNRWIAIRNERKTLTLRAAKTNRSNSFIHSFNLVWFLAAEHDENRLRSWSSRGNHKHFCGEFGKIVCFFLHMHNFSRIPMNLNKYFKCMWTHRIHQIRRTGGNSGASRRSAKTHFHTPFLRIFFLQFPLRLIQYRKLDVRQFGTHKHKVHYFNCLFPVTLRGKKYE